MRKKSYRIISIIMLVLVIFSVGIVNVKAAEKTQMNRYNVVFVTDASGSMKSTDPDGYRFEAIELFVGLLANGGNRVGSVVFNNGVVSQHDLVEVSGRTEKKSITEQVRGQEAKGWTDIGSGLLTAVNMLDEKGDTSLPSIVILLTDGNTEMKTQDETDASISKKEDALEKARENGVQVYTISLNKDRSANSKELMQIASATGGEFQEVTEASDLQSVFDIYYQMIYSTKSLQLVDEKVPQTGVISRDFNVADLGVEEVNIVIFGKVNNCKLTRPGGTEVSDAELNDMLYTAKTFSLLKIPSPEKGVWNLTVNAEPGSTLKIFKIYNANLMVDASIVDQKDSYILNQDINFIAKIMENEQIITDINRYEGYKAVLEVKDYTGNIVHKQEEKNATADGYKLSFVPKDYGTYYAKVSVETEELYAESEVFALNVGNTPPVAAADVIKRHINRWPFLIKTDSTIDLSETAKDAEDDKMQYKVASSTWLEDDYCLNGDKLTIEKFSVSKGSFTIEAYDSKGAYCTYEIAVTSTNIGLWAVILILVGILLTLAIMGLYTYKCLLLSFMGAFTIENIATGETATMQKGRGRLRLSSFQVGNTKLDRKSYFQATGKNYVYYVSPKAVYADNAFKKTKKVKISNSMDVRISTTSDYENGIIVRFESML